MINSVISPPSAQQVVSSSEKDFFLLPEQKSEIQQQHRKSDVDFSPVSTLSRFCEISLETL